MLTYASNMRRAWWLEKIHHGQQTPPEGAPTLQGQAIWKYLGGPLQAAATSLRFSAIQGKLH